MDVKTLLVILIPSILSSVIALTSLILGILREKKRNDDFVKEFAKDIVLKIDFSKYIDPSQVSESAVLYHYLLLYLKAAGSETFAEWVKSSEDNLLNWQDLEDRLCSFQRTRK